MTLNRSAFKKNEGEPKYLVSYIDDEGSKIPIESQHEYHEALKFAESNGNHLNLVLTFDKVEIKDFIAMFDEIMNSTDLSKSIKVLTKSHLLTKNENNCQCKDSPEWFCHWMKKFKKEVMHDLKLMIHETISKEFEKLKKRSKTKSESEGNCDSKNLSSPGIKNKKKKADKDLPEQALEQRERKLFRKIEKLYPNLLDKFESRLEKLDNKTFFQLEERKKLLEKKRYKLKGERKSLEFCRRKGDMCKSGFFPKEKVILRLPAGEQFSITIKVGNDGYVPWVNPYLDCILSYGITLEATTQSLPKLKPGENCKVNLDGSVSEEPGSYFFQYRIMDGSVDLKSRMLCWIETWPKTGLYYANTQPYCPHSESLCTYPKSLYLKRKPSPKLTEEFMKSEKNQFLANSKRKMEENINEIEKRLQDIDLFWPIKLDSEPSGSNSGSSSEPSIEAGKMNPKYFPTTQAEFSQGKPSSEKIQNNNAESGSESDSELSVILMSEEDENFIVIPLFNEKPENDGEKVEEAEFVQESLQLKETEKQETNPPKTDESPKIENLINHSDSDNDFVPDSSEAHHNSSEQISLKVKGKKSHYTPTSLPQQNFFFNPDTSKPFTFNVNTKNGKVLPEEHESKIIFAVSPNGQAVPIEHFVKSISGQQSPYGFQTPLSPSSSTSSAASSTSASPNREKEFSQVFRSQRLFEKFNHEHSSHVPTNIFPNVLVNGASNMASLALNTAKSMINNLQSAFVSEGKTEMGKPACELQISGPVSMESMYKLYEMGFHDLQTNRIFLAHNSNDLAKTIEHLIELYEKKAENYGQQ